MKRHRLDPLDPQLSAEEAASLLGLSRRQVYRQLAEGIIPARKVGSRYLIWRADVEKLLTAGTAASVSDPPFPILTEHLLRLLAGEELVFEHRVRLVR